MTTIATRKTIIRAETSCQIRQRPLMIELTPLTVILREKGRRARFEVSWESVYILAAQIAANKARAERKARKRGKL